MSDNVECAWGECGRAARWQIGLMLWALATPAGMRTKGNAAKLLTGLTVCDDCRSNVKAEDFLLPEGRERIATGLHRAGGAMPDFTSAQLVFEEIVGAPVSIADMLADAKRAGHPIIEA